MSDFNWCHGPDCHKEKTVDRVRGVKGSKVLRTRKIKLNQYNKDWWTKYFCGNGCFNQFVNRNLERVVAIAPRTDCLETPIEDPTKKQNEYGWVNWNIKVDESRQIEQDNPINKKGYMTEQVNTKQSEFLLIDDEKNTPDLKGAQEFVGGMVECVTFPNGDLLIINEEGKLMNLPLNPEATLLWRMTFTKDKYVTGYDDFVVGPAIYIKKHALKNWA